MAKQKQTRIAKLRNTINDGRPRSLTQLAKATNATPGTVNQYLFKLRREGVEIVAERGNRSRPTTYRLAGRKVGRRI